MRKWIFGVLLLFALPLAVLAQDEVEIPAGKMGEQIQAQKVAFITVRLKLTSEEAQKFWPIYNEYESDQKRVRQKYKSNKQDIAMMTDAEAEQAVTSNLEMEQQLLNLKKDYVQRMRKVIPIRKVAMLNRVERAFKEELLNRLKELRQQRRLNRN